MRVVVAPRVLALSLAFAATGTHAQEPAVDAYEQPGPYRVTVEREALCCDRKRKKIDVYRPTGADADRPMPVITWGNGTFASPEKYDYLLRHLASWGMIVVATRDNSVARGETMRDAIDRLERAGTVRIDRKRIAAVGHSQGAGGAVNAMIAAGGGIATVIAIDLPGQQFCRSGDCDQIPAATPARTSIFFLSGSRDGISPPRQPRPTRPPLQSNKAYYDAVPPGRAKLRAAVREADHNDVQGQPRCGFMAFGCRRGVDGFLGYATAWLVWRLDIDPRAQRVFNDAGRGSIFDDGRMVEVEAGWRPG